VVGGGGGGVGGGFVQRRKKGQCAEVIRHKGKVMGPGSFRVRLIAHNGRQSYAFGCMAREPMIDPGGAIVHFLSVFGTIEETSANNHPRRCDRLLPQCVEETSTNNRPRRCDCSLPQCANSHYERTTLRKIK
jgi:hypothetical protein